MSLNDHNPSQQPSPLAAGDTNPFGGVADDLDLDGPMASDAIGYDFEDDTAPAPEPATDPEPSPEPDPKPDPKPEPEPESDPKPESDPEPEPDADPDADPTQNRVPVKRLNKEIEKRRAAEEQYAETTKQIEELRKQIADASGAPVPKPTPEPAAVQADMVERMKAILNQTLDGDVDTSATAMAEMMQQIQADAITQANVQASQTYDSRSSVSRQEQMLNDEAAQIVLDYPVFDNTSESYDAGISDETVELRDAYISSGWDSHIALRKAADMVTKLHGHEKVGAPLTAPVIKPVTKPTQRNIEAAATTPPKQQGELDTQRKLPNVEEMTESEFDNLTDAELSKLRGDYDF